MAFLSHLRPNNKSKKPITKRKTPMGIKVTKATPRVAIITASVATAANAPTIELRQLMVIPATRTSVNASTNSTDAARNAAITIAHCIYFFSFSYLLTHYFFPMRQYSLRYERIHDTGVGLCRVSLVTLSCDRCAGPLIPSYPILVG